MKGILLAGGTGSRLYPLTRAVSKQLLPVFNKPMIYYPLSTLMMAGATEILIVTTSRDLSQFQTLLDSGSQWGLSFTFAVQEEPTGIADALLLGEGFANGDSIALMLGDNILYGSKAGLSLKSFQDVKGSVVFAQHVKDPSRYGVIELNDHGLAVSIDEKPTSPKSNLAVTGLYFFDNSCFRRAKELTPSPRGELEVTDLILSYLKSGNLEVQTLPRGTAWLDTGTLEALSEASEFVRAVEATQGFMIGCVEEIAWTLGYLTDSELLHLAENSGTNNYAGYLKQLVRNQRG